MAEKKWTFSPLQKGHDRSEFDCGDNQLNDFINKLASQYQKKNFARVFVATKARSKVVKGFYSMSSGSVDLSVLSEKERKRLPRHPVPVVHLGRLGVCKSVQAQGLGEALLMDALQRILAISDNEIGIYAVEVVAIDDRAASFYARYGFQSLLDNTLHMYLPMKILKQL